VGSAAQTRHARQARRPDPDAGRLLIFDDDPGVGNVIRTVAATGGLESVAVTHFEEFLAAVDDWRPTHIALDLLLPDADVSDVLAELAGRRCAAQIIMTSGVGIETLRAAGRSALACGLRLTGLLPKPFSAAELRVLISAPATPRAG
jgi:DNA-binding response OmpR family regulator